jgi:hypothetical protein
VTSKVLKLGEFWFRKDQYIKHPVFEIKSQPGRYRVELSFLVQNPTTAQVNIKT